MSDLYKRISGSHNGPLEDLMEKIPGFKGYQEMTDRRSADTLLRNQLATQLKAELQVYISAEKAVLQAGGLSQMSRMKDIKSKIQLFIDRISAAMPGYSGFYDSVKVGPLELQSLYTFDNNLFDFVDKFKAGISAVRGAATTKEGLDKALTELEMLAEQANATFTERENVITRI
jgi:hypothetical protein